MSTEAWDALKAAEARMRDCVGWQLRREQGEVARSYRVLERNCAELRTLLAASAHPDVYIGLLGLERRAEFEAFLDEVVRLLHNYAASVMTLVDHTRIHIEDHYPPGSSQRAVYQGEVARLFDTPSAAFVQDLRNYILHRGLPAVAAQLRAQNIGVEGHVTEFRVLLDLDALRSFKWKSQAKVYLDACDEPPDLLDLVSAYMTDANAFYRWFNERQAEWHKAEFDELGAVYDAYLSARRAVGFDE